MGNTDRPLSPHLQIYKPQLTAALSIAHRASGIFLVIGTLLVGLLAHGLARGPKAMPRRKRFSALSSAA